MTSNNVNDNDQNPVDKNKLSMKIDSEYDTKEIKYGNESDKLRYFTFHIYKKIKLKIYKPLLMLKFALFFWFAGGMGSQAFLSVYLKQRGLSIAHVSFATAASVVFQLLGSSFSAVIADKIGRSKPIIFAHMMISVIVSLTFMVLPSIPPDATIHHFWLRSSNHENISNLIAESWCNHSDAFIIPKMCNIFDTANLQYSYNEQNCYHINSNKNSLVFSSSFDFNDTNTFLTPELCHQENNEIIFTSPPLEFCNFTYCKFLGQECLSEIEKCQERGSNRILLLSVYGLLITLHHMARSSIFRFFDLTVLSLITEHDADFGRQRVFSILGSLVGPSLIGYVLQATSPPDDRKNYSMAFAFSGIFTVLSGISCWNVSIRVKDPGRRMWKKAGTLLKEPDILVFILLLTIMGTAYNFIAIFVGWYLEDLGASELLIGTLFPACNLFTVVFLYTSKWWVNKFGVHNLFIIGLLSHAVFGISYSFLEVPWVALLVGSFTIVFFYHIFWVAVMHYTHKIAPDGLYATVIVTAGVLHFIVTRVTATLIGGLIMNAYGGRMAFRVMGCMTFITAVLYGIFHYFRHVYSKRHRQK